MTLYDELKAAGVEIDNHESDLYFPVTPETVAILRRPEHRLQCQIAKQLQYLNNVTQTFWFDVPFAFEPWWERRASK